MEKGGRKSDWWDALTPVVKEENLRGIEGGGKTDTNKKNKKKKAMTTTRFYVLSDFIYNFFAAFHIC